MTPLPVTCLAGVPVAVLGLGKSGMVAAEALRAGGARVTAWDDGAAARAAAAARGFALAEPDAIDWGACRALVISPGIPHLHPRPHPAAAAARAHGVEIVGDIELLWRTAAPTRWIGITGTNGKSTTTALIGHALATCGIEVRVGGNIGIPALALPPAGAAGAYVLEMSSYQLEITPSAVFDVAVLLNISPDHLDRHGGMDGYVAAKRAIFHGQRDGATAIVGVDDPVCADIHAALAARGGTRTLAISAARREGVAVSAADGILVDAIDGAPREVADLRAIATLPGRHNWQNAAAAYAACRAMGVAPAAIAAALAGYAGLPHRQERVGEIGGVDFVNDSKATNADAAARALGCYDAIWWIAGGIAKAGGIEPLAPLFPRVRHAYLIGEAAAAFAATLARAGVPHSRCGTLEAAVDAAAGDAARAGGERRVVLLSPACASFDQFANFEARGERFRALVAARAGQGDRP
jgi:UDP-N-acetylmuramoylalanine--D-glutamate ligase